MVPLLAFLAAASPTPAPAESLPPDAAVISNSGSTNTAPYRVVVRPDGSARVEVAEQEPETKTLSKTTADALFGSVRAAMPLDALKTVPCMKSASFGTSTFVTYKGSKSPDLSCTQGKTADRLSAAVAKVTLELGITVLRRYGGLRQTHMVPASPPPPTATPKS